MAATLSMPSQSMSFEPVEVPAPSQPARNAEAESDGDAGSTDSALLDLPTLLDASLPGVVCHAPLSELPSGPLKQSSQQKHWALEEAASSRSAPQPCKDGIARLCKQLLSGGQGGEGDLNPYNIPALKSFLTSPAPEDLGMIQCRVLRESGKGLNAMFPKYTLELDSRVLVLTAQKQMHSTSCNYALLLPEAVCPNAGQAERSLGRVNPDFCGLTFTGYGDGLNPKKVKSPRSLSSLREELIVVQYNSSVMGSLSPGARRMSVTIPRVGDDGERYVCQPAHPKAEGLLAMKEGGDMSCFVDVYHSKEPERYQDGVSSFDFAGRVTESSAKNFQLISRKDPDAVFVQFGRVGKGTFHLDFRFPFSPIQAFAACLSTFDFKLCCE